MVYAFNILQLILLKMQSLQSGKLMIKTRGLVGLPAVSCVQGMILTAADQSSLAALAS